MDEIKKLRAQLDDFVSDEGVVQLDDEQWWLALCDLIDPVIDARVEAQYDDNGTHKIVRAVLGAGPPETGEIQ